MRCIFPTLVLLIATASACHVNVDEDKEPDPNDGSGDWHRGYQSGPRGSGSSAAQVGDALAKNGFSECRTDSYGGAGYTLICKRNGEDSIWTNCKGSDCGMLPVSVHYMVNQNLGTSSTIRVEAFDNEAFHGTPAAVTLLTSFDTSRIGTYAQDELYLAPGEYFLRAYVAPDDGQTTPYEYRGMDLIAGHPVGYFGVASGPERVVIKDEEKKPKPVEILLDRLYEDPNARPATEARIRVALALAEGITANINDKVFVELHTHDDFAFKPAYRFELAGESFKVQGREGKAELVTADLEPGQYYVRAFLDTSANGYADAGEPTATWMVGGAKALVNVIEQRTEALALTLAVEAAP